MIRSLHVGSHPINFKPPLKEELHGSIASLFAGNHLRWGVVLLVARATAKIFIP